MGVMSGMVAILGVDVYDDDEVRKIGGWEDGIWCVVVGLGWVVFN
jgi:hypothetical protein